AFICIGRCPMLWLFRPYRGLFFILLTAKVWAKPVLKIFAFMDCGYAFFLLSANIYQATFSVRKGLCLKTLKSILNRKHKSRSSLSPAICRFHKSGIKLNVHTLALLIPYLRGTDDNQARCLRQHVASG